MVVKTPEKTRTITAQEDRGRCQSRRAPDEGPDSTRGTRRAVPHLEATYEHWRPNAGKQREDQFSDGTLRLIGLFWALLDGEAPLLLEEPELSLHSANHFETTRRFFFRSAKGKESARYLSALTAQTCCRKGASVGKRSLVLRPDKEGTVVEAAASIKEVQIAARFRAQRSRRCLVPRTARWQPTTSLICSHESDPN